LTNKDNVGEDTTVGEAPAGTGLDVRIAWELIDQARAQGVSLVGPGGLLNQVTRTVLQTALEAEMTDHLGYEKGDPAGRGRGNHRNGSSPKTVQTEVGAVQLDIPRDRAGGFAPQIVPSTPAGSRASTTASSSTG
jgi:putative transposase